MSNLVRLHGSPTFAVLLGCFLHCHATPIPEPLTWDSLTKQHTLAPGETSAQFTFSVTNVSAGEVVLEKVTTSCGCTAVQLPAQPWRLQPGAHGDLKFTMNLAGKHGTITKTATVQTSVGTKVLTLTAIIPDPGRDALPRVLPSPVAADVSPLISNGARADSHRLLQATQGRAGSPLPAALLNPDGAHGVTHPTPPRGTAVPAVNPPEVKPNATQAGTPVPHVPRLQTPVSADRARNQSLALADHQAVFRSDCARCHAEPAKGKLGQELYVTVCGICHDAEHRADMVSLLSKSEQAGNAAYWRTWITFGKPGSLMPAFSKPLGGPLTREQIESLSKFLADRQDIEK